MQTAAHRLEQRKWAVGCELGARPKGEVVGCADNGEMLYKQRDREFPNSREGHGEGVRRQRECADNGEKCDGRQQNVSSCVELGTTV